MKLKTVLACFIINSKAYIEVTQVDFNIVRSQCFLYFRPQILYNTKIAKTGGHLFPLAMNKNHIVQTGLIYI